MDQPNQTLNSLKLSDLEKLIETVVQQVLARSGIKLNQSEETMLSYQDNLTPEERVKNWLDFVASLPKTSANLPDKVLHRDNMYN